MGKIVRIISQPDFKAKKPLGLRKTQSENNIRKPKHHALNVKATVKRYLESEKRYQLRNQFDAAKLYIEYPDDNKFPEWNFIDEIRNPKSPNEIKVLKSPEWISTPRKKQNWKEPWEKGKYIYVQYESKDSASYAKAILAKHLSKMAIYQNWTICINFAIATNKRNLVQDQRELNQVTELKEKEGNLMIFHPVANEGAEFFTRKIKLTKKDQKQEIQIGRSHGKPSEDNLIFDWEFGSRNHAMISYDRNDLTKNRFLLQDSKSKYGTFINDTELEENDYYSIKSGDIIRFGIKLNNNEESFITAKLEITEKVLRPVIIDGCNICHAYQDSLTNGSRSNNKFYLDGIGVVYNHFKSLGYEDRNIHIIMKHIPERERSDTFNSMLDWFQKTKGVLKFPPSRRSGPGDKLVISDDDLFILNTALQLNGIVVSRDHYRKEKAAYPKYRDLISYRLLQPTFIGRKLILPDDPLGTPNPTLFEFLRISY